MTIKRGVFVLTPAGRNAVVTATRGKRAFVEYSDGSTQGFSASALKPVRYVCQKCGMARHAPDQWCDTEVK